MFKHIFDGCSMNFQRELINKGTFSYYSSKQEEDFTNHICIEIDHPVIDDAFQHSQYLYLILSGCVHIMDQAGMYDYGFLKSGCYFGDISILLGQPNKYAYFYNPHSEKPLQLLHIKRNDFLDICQKFPVEHEIWVKRALIRQKQFDSYKSKTLLGYMKTIIKNPDIIRQNREMFLNKKLTMVQRLVLLRHKLVKVSLIKFLVRYYDIKRASMKALFSKNQSKKHNKGQMVGSSKGERRNNIIGLKLGTVDRL